jgi:hypothetical protein
MRQPSEKEVNGSHDKGKSWFYRESIRITQEMVDGQLLGHGGLRLGSKPKDYGEIRFYLGPSSSRVIEPTREESYVLLVL